MREDMQVAAETTIDHPRTQVSDYIARAERLPEYVTQFASVRQLSEGEPGRGRTGNARALERLKALLEGGTS